MDKLNLTRKWQTYCLIMLTALTLMPQYALQGVMASGHNANQLPWAFWIAEYSAWSLRALIEAASIMFLFETTASENWQRWVLSGFKVAMISLISLTIAPVVFAKGIGQNSPEVLSVWAYWLWSFGVATYAPLMLASVGTAYAIMPDGTQSPNTPTIANDVANTLNSKMDAMAGILDRLQATLDAKSKQQNDVDSKAARQAQIVAMRAQGVSGANELAQALGVSAMTVRRDLAELGISNGHANGHNGHTKLI